MVRFDRPNLSVGRGVETDKADGVFDGFDKIDKQAVKHGRR
jgi:hypothetical protein